MDVTLRCVSNDSAVVYIFNCTKYAIQCMFIVLENSSRQELFLVLLCTHKCFYPDKFRLPTGHPVNFSQSQIIPAEECQFDFVSLDDTCLVRQMLKAEFPYCPQLQPRNLAYFYISLPLPLKVVYWSGLSFPSPEDLPDLGIKPGSPALQADFLPYELKGSF